MDRCLSFGLVPLALLALSSSAPAQAGGFVSGDIYYNGVLPDGGAPAVGLFRIDPQSGQHEQILDYLSGAYPGGAAYDPYRDRIVLVGALEELLPHVYALDAAGAWQRIHDGFLSKLAPRGDGLVYGHMTGGGPDLGQRIHYLDASDELQVLMDETGSSPFEFQPAATIGFDVRALIYAPSVNALFVASEGDNPGHSTCSGGASLNTVIRKVPLSADGTRVAGPVVCSEYDVSPTAAVFETPLDWSHGPAGTLVLSVRPSTNGLLPRLLSVDPVGLAVTPFAWTGYPGDAGISAAVYSPRIARVFLHDDANDVFRTYAAGASGGGTEVAGDVSGFGSMLVVGAPCPPATAETTFRNAGTNPASFAASSFPLGGTAALSVELSTTGHAFAQPFAFDTPFAFQLTGGQTLLCIDLGSGELLGLPFAAGPLAVFGVNVPHDASLCGFSFTCQAIHFGGVFPFALSNARDVVIGN